MDDDTGHDLNITLIMIGKGVEAKWKAKCVKGRREISRNTRKRKNNIAWELVSAI